MKNLDSSVGGAGRHKRWVCVCPICGKDFITQSNHLIGDKIKSCPICSRRKYESLAGKKFHSLTVIKRLFEYKYTTYLCKCDCGNYHTATVGHLKSGTVKSCGCLKSQYEQLIRQILENNNIHFEAEKIFSECRAERCLPFDFYIPEINLLVEMQGEQHYKPVIFWGAEAGLKKRQEYDRIKEEFCIQNGYKLLKIAYNENIEQRVNEEIVWPLRK